MNSQQMLTIIQEVRMIASCVMVQAALCGPRMEHFIRGFLIVVLESRVPVIALTLHSSKGPSLSLNLGYCHFRLLSLWNSPCVHFSV